MQSIHQAVRLHITLHYITLGGALAKAPSAAESHDACVRRIRICPPALATTTTPQSAVNSFHPPDRSFSVSDDDDCEALINQYIARNQTIILVVIPCNLDIATTEALQLARDVDPRGERTLGVLTKPDLMDPGTEVTQCGAT